MSHLTLTADADSGQTAALRDAVLLSEQGETTRLLRHVEAGGVDVGDWTRRCKRVRRQADGGARAGHRRLAARQGTGLEFWLTGRGDMAVVLLDESVKFWCGVLDLATGVDPTWLA
jgi:hypothetical protein